MLCAVVPALLLMLAPGCSDAAPHPGAAPLAGRQPAPAPVVVVLIDTLRPDHTSVGGYGRDTTPFLAELADESIVFERAYAPASWTRASVASLFSARLPESHGCEDRDGQLVPEILTLAEVLREHGYATRGVIANGNVKDTLGFGQGFERYDFIKDWPAWPYADAARMEEPVTAAFDELAARGPFFLYLHYVDPHDPYIAHPETDFSPEYDGPMDGARETLKPYNGRHPPPAEKQRAIDLYDGEILWLDGLLRRIVGDLAARELLGRAWIVITSDHGEGLWDHRVQSHGQEVFEEQIRVPLVVRPPGGLAARHVVREPISLIDVAPTLLELLGVAVPGAFEGRSWAPSLRGSGPAPARPVVVDEQMDMFHLASIIDGDDKLIIDYGRRTRRLYDLAENPRELDAQAIDLEARRSARGEALERELLRALEEARRRRPSGTGGAELDDETRAQLEAMGYVQDPAGDG